MTICTCPAFQDDAPNWQGADIDVMQAIADHLDLTLAVVPVPFESIWTAPAAGTCAIAAAAITVTEAGSTEAAFSDPYSPEASRS